MNPLHLRAENYRTFPTLDLDLPAGCVAVVGPNGAGKSSIVNAVDLALFGADGRTLADQLCDDGFETELMIELEFEHGGDTYRVRRGYSARGAGKSTCDFEVAVAGYDELDLRAGIALAHEGIDPGLYYDRWEPLTRESAKATTALIEQTIGLTRQTFRASAFLAQGDGAAFTEASPRDRKAILTEVVLGRDPVWPRLAKQAHDDKRAHESELEQLAGATLRDEQTAAGRADVEHDQHVNAGRLQTTTEDLAAAEARLTEISERWQAGRERAARRDAAAAELRAARAEADRLYEAVRTAEAAHETITAARAELATLAPPTDTPALEAQRQQLDTERSEYRDRLAARAQAQDARDRCHRERVEARTTAGALNERASDLREIARQKKEAADATCQTCGQHIADAAKEKALADLEAQAVEHEAKARACDEEAEKLRLLIIEGDELLAAADALPVPDDDEYMALVAGIAAAHASGAQRATLEERIRQAYHHVDAAAGIPERLDEQLATVATLEQALAALEPVDLEELERAGRAARGRVDDARTRLTETLAEQARLQERVAQIMAADERLAEAAAKRTELQAHVDLCAVCERAFGRDGIPALILENTAIPQIETEANRILTELGTPYRVELRTQAATKAGELRDVLDVIVAGDTAERAYETFSGGERTRINLALRIALAELLATRRGAASRLLVIDEPEFLDEAGTSALARVLQTLTGFDRVYLVSHVPGLRDAFDQVLSVVKDGARSRIESGEVVAVLA